MPRALDVRLTPVLMLVLALCAALLALAPAGPAHAQAPAGVVDAATAHLAEQLDVDPAGLELLRSEAVTWSDGCLGVHEPDIACTTALVDGFALWLSDGDVAYRYHTDATGTVVRLAESGIALGEVAGAPLPEGEAGPAPPPEPAPLPEGEDEPAPPPEGEDEAPPLPEPAPEPAHTQAPAGVVAAAAADLAEQLDVDASELELLRSEAVVWSDGCLGVHEPDIACTTALVDGFALWLSDGDVAYRYHTDATGTVVRLAESGIPLGEVEAPPLPEGDDEPAPPPEPVPVDIPPAPEALPASGSGGLANDTDAPAWVWAVIAAVALSAIATGGAYRLWLRSRRR